MSRSEFFTRAAERYLDDLDSRSLTDQIDAALDQFQTPDETAVDAVAVGHRVLESVTDQW